MPVGIVGVCIDPPVVEFFDVKPGEVYRTTVTVTNTGKNNRRMRLRGPMSKPFKLQVVNPDMPIAAGLSFTGTVEYRAESGDDARDRLVLICEDDVTEIPLLAFCLACSLQMDLLADFGTVVANSQIISKDIEITNNGSAPGFYKILYRGDTPLTIKPANGILAPRNTQLVKVELCTDQARRVIEEAQVKLQGQEDVVLKILVDIVEHFLELLDPNQNEGLSCLRFGPAYFGTSRMERVILVNSGPQPCDWVAVLQDDAIGTEVGTDLQSSTDAALLDRKLRNSSPPVDIRTVITCLPNEGRLGPYERTVLCVCFSPVSNRNLQGPWDSAQATRQDFSVFMKFEIVGSKDVTQKSNASLFCNGEGQNYVELAVTGSGIPVSLVAHPSNSFHFQQCMMGEHMEVLCVLHNRSPLLPVAFRFRKIANFLSNPSMGHIAPGQSQDLVLTFSPHQIGKFRVQQVVEVLDQVAKLGYAPPCLRIHSICHIILHLSAVCKAPAARFPPKFNAGITPMITNETGQFVEIRLAKLDQCADFANMAVLSAAKTRLHSHRRTQNSDLNQLVAFPNDRAASVRPDSSGLGYRTIFTRVPRYSYIDPDFAYTDEEVLQRKKHKEYYLSFIRSLRDSHQQRTNKRIQGQIQNEVDIGLCPAAGLLPPKLSLRDLEIDDCKGSNSSDPNHLLFMDTRSTSRQVMEGINAVPCTTEEVADCRRILTPQQLRQVVIGPSMVDFGEVCERSVSSRQLSLVNNLQWHVWLQLEVSCPQLQLSSPLSYVLPPLSSTTLPLIFESDVLGTFRQSIPYKVNQRHLGHVLVQGQVVQVALELSAPELVLSPTHSFLARSGYRSTVTLYNRLNHPASFTWKPIVTDAGIAFSIRPATGTVVAYQELDCEVVWHPSFSSPLEGQFDLCVHHGSIAPLRCIAKVGTTTVQIAEKHIVFGIVPLNFTTVKTAVLKNTGHNPAYFQVCDVYPLPGMMVTPSEGEVPVGGQTEIQVHFTPGAVMRFDTRVEIALRNMKSLELRVGGSVELPLVDINVKLFQFHGVHSGSSRAISFSLHNYSLIQACVQFHLTEHDEFTVAFAQNSGPVHTGSVQTAKSQEQPHYVIEMEGQETVECFLIFSPKQVAAYDFILPVTLNSVGAPSPPVSPVPNTPSDKHIVTPRPQNVSVAMPSCRVQATALRAPLELSQSNFYFEMDPLEWSTSVLDSQSLELRNISQEDICWRLDQSAASNGSQEGLFIISLETGTLQPGQSVCIMVTFSHSSSTSALPEVISVVLPLFLFGEKLHPYRLISLRASVCKPSITFLPPRVILAPVPLGTEATATLSLLPTRYTRGSSLRVETEVLELEDGSKSKPFSVTLPDRDTILPQRRECEQPIICIITFRSSQPLACTSHITFVDLYDNRFQVEVCAVTDNCLLTVWPYLALHRSDQQIYLRSDHLSGELSCEQLMGQAVIGPCPSTRSLCHSTSSSSTFTVLSSTSEDSQSDSGSESGRKSPENRDLTERMTSMGLPSFPPEESAEGYFHHTVLKATQDWAVSKVQTSSPALKKTTYQVSHGRDTKTIYDMLLHLSGQMLPGVNGSQSLPCSLSERLQELHRQHATLLAFLRVQGASLSHLKPEYLLEPQEFHHWSLLQTQLVPLDQDAAGFASSVKLDEIAFESLSKRAWTDVLLQTYKVFVLPRVTEGGLEFLQDCENAEFIPRINTEPLSSNIYSPWERKLLIWLNLHYHRTRSVVWGTSSCKDNIPPARWIVNFDLDLVDGLVLATAVASYCPFLISTHFKRMYTSTTSLEQNLHNSIILCNALRVLCLDTHIQATEISDPNPVRLLMLCVHLYERLPQYLTRKTIILSGSLHDSFTRQLRLKNPSSKLLVYHASIVGNMAAHFCLPHGNTVTIPPKSHVDLLLQFSGNFLQPLEATLLLMSRALVTPLGATMAFTLCSQVNYIKPAESVKCRSPCYQLKETRIRITNHFNEDATFRVVLIESKDNLLQITDTQANIIQQATAVCDQNPDGRTSLMNGSVENGESEKGLHSETSEMGSITEFFSPERNVWLRSGGMDYLDIHFLPFHLGKKYCFILLVNCQVGELVYMVEATADFPLPSPLMAEPSPNRIHPSSAITAAGSSSPKAALCFKCSVGGSLQETLCVPLVNEAWENALATVGKQHMSPLELKRRRTAGTLNSSTVRAKVAASVLTASQALPVPTQTQQVEYSVELSMPENFFLPETISLPLSSNCRIPLDQGTEASTGQVVLIPLRFEPKAAGRYLCQVALSSWRDVRVHFLEVVVHGEGIPAHLEFTIPAHSSLTQDIPLNNESPQDWRLRAVLAGPGFFGPSVLCVLAGERVCYPLTFKPTTECIVTGCFSLLNDTDGTEHNMALRGVGQRPLVEDNIVIHCPVHGVMQKVLQVPNYSERSVTCKVVSDLSIVSGPPSLDIKPGQTVPYTISVSPWKRGTYTGVMSFVAEEKEQSLGDMFTSEGLGQMFRPYEVWFSFELICFPAQPMKVILVQCAVHSTVAVEIPISNPRANPLLLQVCVEGPDLSGDTFVHVPPQGCLSYLVTFFPATIGKKVGSVIFTSELVGEFWYQLDLVVDPPAPTTLPDCTCELGKCTQMSIPLINPTDETLELDIINSNPRNFTVEQDLSQSLVVAPHSITQVPVQFCPSSLGSGNHTACISFTCKKLGEWKFWLSGRGEIPGLMEALSVSTCVGSQASLVLPFRNPTDDCVVVDLLLTDEEQSLNSLPPSLSVQCHETEVKAFHVPLRKKQGIPLNPRASLDVPVLFAPTCMQLYQAWLVIQLEPQDGQGWGCAETERSKSQQNRSCVLGEDGTLRKIRWVYPIHGIPETVLSSSHPAVISCQSRCRAEEHIEVLLTGCVPRSKAPLVAGDRKSGLDSTTLIAQGSRLMLEDFLFEVRFASKEDQAQLEQCVALSLLGHGRDPESGIVTLRFNIVFAPCKPLRCAASLAVRCITGGLWKFPIMLISTEPQVDDVIKIEAAGLHKTSGVSFRLTSQTRYPETFTAKFLPGSGPEFQVSPCSGELPPVSSLGTLITITFTPRMYGKNHCATLLVQTNDMQWIYKVNGVPPLYSPPCPHSLRKLDSSSPCSSGLQPTAVRKQNFLQQNRQLPDTLDTSATKNLPLVQSIK